MKNKFIFSGLLAVAMTVMSFAPVSALETNNLKGRNFVKVEGYEFPVATDSETRSETPLTSSNDIQDAFDAIYPNSKVSQGELVTLEEVQNFLATFGMDSGYIVDRGNIEDHLLPITDEDDLTFMAFGALKPGVVNLTLKKEDVTYPLTFTITSNAASISLTPDNATIKPGEEVDILIDADWWIWFDENGEVTSILIEHEFNGTNVASIKTLNDEDGNFIGYTVTGKKEGTATLSIKSDDGKYSAQSTITVKNAEKPVVKPETPAAEKDEVLGAEVSNKNPNVVQTSDNTDVVLYSATLAISLLAIAGYTILRKKEN